MRCAERGGSTNFTDRSLIIRSDIAPRPGERADNEQGLAH